MFDRYDIVDEADLRAGVSKLAHHLEAATGAKPDVLPFQKPKAAEGQQTAVAQTA